MPDTVEDQGRQLVQDRAAQYKRTFRGATGKAVLEDLAVFCRATESTFHPDARVAANLDGRREVFLRIMQHLEMDPKALYRLLR